MASGIATKRQDKELTSLLITRCYKKTGTRWRFPEVNFSDPDVNINSCLHNSWLGLALYNIVVRIMVRVDVRVRVTQGL